MKKIISLFFVLLIYTNCFSQPPAVDWQKSIGGSSVDTAKSIQNTSDGGYIIAGYSYSNDVSVNGNHGHSDYWIVKIDSIGNVQWEKLLGGTNYDFAQSIQITSDGGYIVAGWSDSMNGDVTGNNGMQDGWIIKLDASGNIQWQKSIGGIGNDRALCIQTTSDGGYIVGGNTSLNNVNPDVYPFDYWLVKLDSTGIIEWQKSLGGSGQDNLTSIQTTIDGGYILAGSSSSNDGDVTSNHGGADYWIVKLSTTGNIQWQKSLGGTGVEVAQSIQTTSDNGYIIAGYSNSNNGDVTGNQGYQDYWIVKLNFIGNLMWQKSLGGGSGNENAYAIQTTIDGGYIVAGSSNSNDGDVIGNNYGLLDYWIVKLNDLGNIQWQELLGGANNDIAFAIQNTTDQGYIIAGSKKSNGWDDYWIVKLTGIAPTQQTFCIGATVQDLITTVTGIQWYENAVGGTALATSDLLAAGTYYCSQTFVGIESVRLAVNVNISNLPDAPIVAAQTFCNNALGANLAPNNATLGDKWYNANGEYIWGNTVLSSGIYYVTKTLNGCESDKTAVLISINLTLPPSSYAQTFYLCDNSHVSSLEATGSSIKWYANSTEDTFLTSNATLSTGTYYVTQTLNECESEKVPVPITVICPSVPYTGNNAYSFCSGKLFDDGGSNGYYSQGADGYTVLNPSIPGNLIQLTGYISINENDWVSIYNGDGIDGELFFDGSGTISIGTITSTVGPLTVKFSTYSSELNIGFDFNVTCVESLSHSIFENNTISIYPNPAKDHITVDCDTLANVVGYSIKITNTLGQEVFNQPMNTQQYYIPLNSWSGQGVYFVNVIDAQGHTIDIKKIILQ